MLVVVGIVSLLILRILPSFAAAREQAKIVVCLSNLRQIGVAHTAYIFETNRVPVGIRPGPRQDVLAPWSFGGKGNRAIWPAVHSWDAGQRPINPYIYPNFSFSSPDPSKLEAIDHVRPELPVFRCPSDTTSYAFLPWGEPSDVPAYEDIGTSYTQNMLYTTCQCMVTKSGHDLQSSLDTGLSKLSMRYGDRFVFYLEEAANEAIHRQKRYMGDHGEIGRHTVAFLDGHAAYVRMDTTQASGENWMMLDPDLPDPFDLDDQSSDEAE